MSTKRETRKQRSDEHREHQDRQRRQRQWRSRALVALGAFALIAALFMSTRLRDGEERNGRVWSAAHGHWHEKGQR